MLWTTHESIAADRSRTKMKRVLFYLAKMADASVSVRAKKIPDSLYELCLTNLVNYVQKSKCERNELRSLPDSILMDVYYKVSSPLVLIYKNSLETKIPLQKSAAVSYSVIRKIVSIDRGTLRVVVIDISSWPWTLNEKRNYFSHFHWSVRVRELVILATTHESLLRNRLV